MIRGVRVQAVNSVPVSAYAGALISGAGLYTVPTGKTFILTDLVCGFKPTAAEGTVPAGIALFDKAFGQNLSAFTAGDIKVMFKAQQRHGQGSGASGRIALGPLVVTDLVNGPEFSTCVSAGNVGTFAVPTYALWIGGIVR
jgi:hypothetical protein